MGSSSTHDTHPRIELPITGPRERLAAGGLDAREQLSFLAAHQGHRLTVATEAGAEILLVSGGAA